MTTTLHIVRLMSSAVLLVGCLSTPVSAQKPPDTTPEQLLTAAANGYKSHLGSFRRVTATYTITVGWSRTLDDAIAGRLEPGSRRTTATWARDGDEVAFRLLEDTGMKSALDNPKGKREKMGGYTVGEFLPFDAGEVSSNGDFTMRHDPRNHSASMFDGGARPELSEDFYLSALLVNKAKDLTRLTDKALTKQILYDARLEMIDGSSTIVVKFNVGKDPITTFHVDPARGYLPTRIDNVYSIKSGSPSAWTAVVTKVRVCSGNRWFPERIVSFLMNDGQTSGLVREFAITELNVDDPPPRSSLTLRLPAGTVVHRDSEPRDFFKTSKDESVTPGDLSKMYELASRARKEPLMDTAITQPRPSALMWYLAAGALILVIVFVVWFRRARRS